MSGIPLLVEFYNELPERVVGPTGFRLGEPGGMSAHIPVGKARWRVALERFRKQVVQRYNEGSLLRILVSSVDGCCRRAAAFSLGLIGSMNANVSLARALHDDDLQVPLLAAEALWSIWFRGDNPTDGHELEKLVRLRDHQQALSGLDRLIERVPLFAEAYNQRAIVAFQLERYERALADCERTLELNPYHFGAQAGLGQCYLRMRRQGAALRAFRAALRIHPHLEHVAEMVRSLEQALGEEPPR